MLVWRLCRRPYADLSGDGGRLASGRWHTAGRPIIYAAYEPALAILEVRVHLDLPFEDLPDDYVLMGIDLSGLAVPIPSVDRSMTSMPDTQATGDVWLSDKSSPVLSVPSVVAPRGKNYLINPLHPDAKAVSIAEIEDFKFDGRLWNKS
jgi:RES domain-containing protein